jgi:D-alanine-D-alanine ligase and related ATP-grasp enzymes
MAQIEPRRIPQQDKERLRVLFMAKHALFGGGMHPEDGNHAIYHHEVRTTLEKIGLNLRLANRYDVLFEKPDADFVFPLLNRGGFVNSEMMIPLLCNRLGLPYVGGSPIIRGLGDDKHLSKLVAVRAGVPTAPWTCYRKGAPVEESALPKADRWVIKPVASSASWAISDAYNWDGVANAVADIHAQGHDAIVEPYLGGYDVQVAFITVDRPVMLPMLIYEREDTTRLWTYYEKRDLIQNNEKVDAEAARRRRMGAGHRRLCRQGRARVRAVRLWPDRIPARPREGRGELHRDQPQLQPLVGEGGRQGGCGCGLQPWRPSGDHPGREHAAPGRDQSWLNPSPSSSWRRSATASSIRSPPKRASPTNAWCRSAASRC